MIAHGIQTAKDELGDAEERAEEGLSPSFMPQDEQRKATGFEVYTFPVSHTQQEYTKCNTVCNTDLRV